MKQGNTKSDMAQFFINRAHGLPPGTEFSGWNDKQAKAYRDLMRKPLAGLRQNMPVSA